MILNSQLSILDGCELLVLFQVKKSVKSLLGAVSKKSLSKDKILHLQVPLQDDDLLRPQAALSPSPGILLFPLSFVDSLLSCCFSGHGFLRGAQYQNLSRLGDPLDPLSEPRYWWCTEYLDRWLGFNYNEC